MFEVCRDHLFWDKFLIIVALTTKDVYHDTIDSLVVPKPKFGELETKDY
jgi:hypothetical protein